MELEFSETRVSGLPVFGVNGRIMGGAESVPLCDRLKELISAGERQIILDFHGIQWMNSRGIGLILTCVNSLKAAGGDIHFVGLKGKAAFYFRITKLDTVLPTYDSLEQAIEQITASAYAG